MTQPTATPPRCGVCANCRHVERTKHLAAPNPPFSHATTDTVRMWNQALHDSPCETWDAAQAAAYQAAIRDGVQPSVRPRRA